MRSRGFGVIVLGLVCLQGCASEPARTADTGRQTAQRSADTSRQTAQSSADTGRQTAQSSATTNAEILLGKLKADKKLLVASNMNLTDSEAAKFWPLYDEYQKELDQINQRLGRTITDYAEAFKKGPIPNSTASNLLDEVLAVEDAEVALKQSYAQRLSGVLPDAKVARYLHIETKIRSILKFELAREIPLVY